MAAMEKQQPHYSLRQVLALVADPNLSVFTKAALQGGFALGLNEIEMRAVVLSLNRKCFYKSMTTFEDYRVWQDVYHGITPDDVAVYIKVTLFDDDRAPVIQFKMK